MKQFTNWTLGAEPNINSAKIKNDQGLCAQVGCTNKWVEKSPQIPGFKICDECRKSLIETCDFLRNSVDEENLDRLKNFGTPINQIQPTQ